MRQDDSGRRGTTTPRVWRRRRRRLALALTASLALAGCAGRDNWIQTYPDVAAQARQDPRSFAVAARAQWDTLRGLAGSYRVRARRGISSRSLDTHIYLLRDALVQIEVVPPTMITEGFVGVSRTEVGLWVSEDPCLYRGPNVPGAFGRALGLELAPEDVVAVLMGFAVTETDGATVSWDEEARRIRVAAGGTTAWLHPVTLRFERFAIATAGGAITGTYEAWAEGDTPVPQLLHVDVEAEGITLEVRLAPAWSANPEGLDEEFFDELPVEGTADCSLDQISAEGGLLRRGLGR